MINLKYVAGNIFVYSVEDWSTLRTSHRIVGQIFGANSFIPALPLKLLPEEALVLLDNRLALIHEKSSTDIVQDNLEEAKLLEDTILEVQQKEYKKTRKEQLEGVIDKIVERKRQLGDNRTESEIFQDELNKSAVITKENMVWPILLTKNNETSLTPVPRDVILSLTSNLRFSIFKDLWERGYFVTTGQKFGGDFLVYFGDPLVHHAIFIVKCIESEKLFRPTELVAFGRLGVSVKKRAVLGTLKDGKVTYITINWIDA